MYDGTLAENWQALITFQQMIILCDDSGVIDLTPSAISRRTGIPIEHIEAGIKTLESDDPYSRTPDENGRRIVRLDDHRPWGWRIVNYIRFQGNGNRCKTTEWVRKREEAFLFDDFTCQYCGRTNTRLECDHIIPISRGGNNDFENLITACFNCNRSKRNKTISEWLR